MPTGVPPGLDSASLAPGKWILICLGLYLVRVMPWALSELWHDEVITLGDFVLGPQGRGPLHVFRAYPVANNHVLFSAFGWWWVRFLGFSTEEYLLRLPCIAFGALVIVVAVRWWRRWLGAELSCVAGVTLAISPVFGAFASEFRGYSLTMLLSGLAATGLAEFCDGRTRRGLWLQIGALMLLPLVIPSNVFLGLSHALFLLLWPGWQVGRRARLGAAAAVAGAAAVGMSFYLTIWDQFVKVINETTGWHSGLMVLTAVAVGVVAHLGLVGFVLPVAAFRRRPVTPGESVDRSWGLTYAGCLAVPILATALGEYRNAPFPRVYLLYLVPLTFAAFRSLQALGASPRKALLLWVGLSVVVGFAWERACAFRTEQAVGRGEHPQDLLQQYYRGRVDLRGLAAMVAGDDGPADGVVLTDAYDFPTFRYYWAQFGRKPESVFAENRLPEALWSRLRGLDGISLHAVAGNEIEAARLFAAAGAPGPFVPGPVCGARRFYTLLPQAVP